MKNTDNIGCILSILIIILSISFLAFLSLWTDRTLDFWCSYFAHHTVNIPIWLSCVVLIVFNAIMLGLNIISEVIRLCL